MSDWQLRRVPLKFGVGDRVLFAHHLRLQVRSMGLGEVAKALESPQPPDAALMPGCQGYFVRALPVACELPRFDRMAGWLRYVTTQYSHYYIDLSGGLEAYRAKFSSKSRSTITRKVRKYTEHCGGELKWHLYDQPEVMPEFHRLARQVSIKTYQERLLDAGIPDGSQFVAHLVSLARIGQVRGYILFHQDRPTAYLCCPVQGNAFIYLYQGYDPEYMILSVGTVLQWLALEDIFARPTVPYFDFTEGTSEHKRLFSTHELRCANVMFVRPTWSKRSWLRLHAASQDGSAWLGRKAQEWGIKAKLTKLLRFGIGGASGRA
jgi:hypothetical protein